MPEMNQPAKSVEECLCCIGIPHTFEFAKNCIKKERISTYQ
jgi:hypothetical protein